MLLWISIWILEFLWISMHWLAMDYRSKVSPSLVRHTFLGSTYCLWKESGVKLGGEKLGVPYIVPLILASKLWAQEVEKNAKLLLIVRYLREFWFLICCAGHTRKVSIPDCVEFTLSTNACRGYCESWSIPSSLETVAQNPHQPVTSVGQCCNMMDTEEVIAFYP